MYHDYVVMELARLRAEELAMIARPELREARRGRSRRRRLSWR
jgi:hypothetical protein